jgi:hypothetical protein
MTIFEFYLSEKLESMVFKGNACSCFHNIVDIHLYMKSLPITSPRKFKGMYMHVQHIYIYIEREREGERESIIHYT